MHARTVDAFAHAYTSEEERQSGWWQADGAMGARGRGVWPR